MTERKNLIEFKSMCRKWPMIPPPKTAGKTESQIIGLRSNNIKSFEEIASMEKAGHAVALALMAVVKAIEEGERNSLVLDKIAEITLQYFGAVPSFKGYHPVFSKEPYPYTMCISVNDEVVHGLPSVNKVLVDQDIVSLDLGANINGLHADSAITVVVGEPSELDKQIIDATRAALQCGINASIAGSTLFDVSKAIYDSIVASGFSPAQDLTGHFIGYNIHELPDVPNVITQQTWGNYVLKPGMTFCIEPMLCTNGNTIFLDNDGWAYKTKDGGRSAHFEHTVVVRENGPATILTSVDGLSQM